MCRVTKEFVEKLNDDFIDDSELYREFGSLSCEGHNKLGAVLYALEQEKSDSVQYEDGYRETD